MAKPNSVDWSLVSLNCVRFTLDIVAIQYFISMDLRDPICYSKLLNSVSMLLVHLQELLPSKVRKTPKNYYKKRKRLLKAGTSDAAKNPVAPSS